MAVGLSFVGVLIYIWFRFDWQFGVGVVGTLLLDITKTVGFFAVTHLPFDLNSVAAIMLLIGYSVTDKIVVYDRIRENLRRFKTMPLRDVIDQSINQTLGRTVATSLTVLLSIVPLAVLGAEIDPRLRAGDHLWDYRWHVVLDLHRLADPLVPRPAPVAPRDL